MGIGHAQLLRALVIQPHDGPQVRRREPLATTVLKGLLKYWPVTNSQKEVLFLGELEEILELTQANEFAQTMVPMFQQVSKCISSSHFQVAERALFLWNNDYIVSLVAQNRHTVLPRVFGALERNARNHWNAAVHGLTCNVRKMFMEMDQPLWEQTSREYQQYEENQGAVSTKRGKQWAAIDSMAGSKK